MQLLRLELKGFKSFADKTIIDFSTGISAIVGPNGSGKSNITDAIRWVLGEANIRNLRGQKTEDVIFAGTEKRKPLSSTEVTIVFDNTDKTLAEELAEVAITRRVYRNGESEFFINKRACRLKDIHRLLADTGLGRDSMAIIGQNKIDAILNSKPEERRLIFEDVAGISLFKMNKEDAQRRLNATERNMERVNDLLFNLDEQLENLQEKANKTIAYNELSKQKRLYDAALFYHAVKTSERIQARLENENISLENEQAEIANALLDLDENEKELSHKFKKLQVEQQNLEEEFTDKIKTVEEYKSKLELYKQKEENIKISLQEKEERLQELELMLTAENNRLLLFSKALIDEQTKAQEISVHLKECIENYEDINKRYETAKYYLQEYEQKKSKLSTDKTQLLNEQKLKELELNNTKQKYDESSQQKVDLISSNNQIEENIENKRKSWQEAQDKYNDIKKEYDYLNTEKNTLSGTLKEIEREIQQVNREIQIIDGRLQILSNWEDEHEGYAESTKAIMRSKEDWRKDIIGAVGDLFEVKPKFSTAIEIALGANVNHVVTSNSKIAADAIKYLKNNRLGRATFLPLDTMMPRHADQRALNEDGIICTALDCLNFEERFYNVFSSILGNIYIAENIEKAIKVQKKYQSKLRIVTIDGEILNAGGSISGGSIRHNQGKILSRKAEKKELENKLVAYKDKAIKLHETYMKIEENISDVVNNLKKIEHKVQASSLEAQKIELELNNLIIIKDKAQHNLQNILYAESEVQQKIHFLEEEIELIAKNLAILEKTELNLQIPSGVEDLEVLQKEQQLAYENLIKAELSRENITKSIAEKENSITEYKNNIDNFKSKEADLIANIAEQKELLAKNLPDELKILDANLELESKKLEELKIKKTQYYAQNNIVQEELKDRQTKVNELHLRRDAIQKKLLDIGIKLAKIKMEVEVALQELVNIGYSKSEASQLGLTGNVSEWHKIQNELQQKIAELGTINPNAVVEFEEAKERKDFLQKQQNDLGAAKEQLQSVISRLDEAMSSQFMDVFKIVAISFQKIFQELFGGGRAELVLTNKSEVLQSGIEMYIQPPGKKLQQLSLLSGGERALTVIALLFAFLNYRPAPVCVLDEVDAPLDEANVERFSEYLKKVAPKTQFIVVTHRKKTMEHASVLQGVTMVEDGVSKMLTVSFDEIEEV